MGAQAEEREGWVKHFVGLEILCTYLWDRDIGKGLGVTIGKKARLTILLLSQSIETFFSSSV